jgi:hypothetical protein
VVAIASSVKLAARLGRWSQACVNPLRRLFNKPKLTTWPDQMVAMRADLVDELRRDGIRLLACVVGGYLLNGVLLVMCLWACGASRDELPLSLGLMLYGVGRIATIVQITPGCVGITEIAYTAVYTAVLGDSRPSRDRGAACWSTDVDLSPADHHRRLRLRIWRVMRPPRAPSCRSRPIPSERLTSGLHGYRPSECTRARDLFAAAIVRECPMLVARVQVLLSVGETGSRCGHRR